MENSIEERAAEKRKSVSKKKLIFMIGLAVILVFTASVIVWQVFFTENEKKIGLGYESSAVAITNQNDLQDMIDGMIQKAKDGTMSLEYKNVAVSANGEDFSCYIVNSIKNKYDMFFSIYKDATLKEELYLTELIPPGSGMKNVRLNQQLEAGTYDAILVFTQVKEDHKTIQSQVSVQLTLNVKK